jgi:hypothetical protein
MDRSGLTEDETREVYNSYHSPVNCELRELRRELNSLKLQVKKMEKIEHELRSIRVYLSNLKK